jgi:hypothetical protein
MPSKPRHVQRSRLLIRVDDQEEYAVGPLVHSKFFCLPCRPALDSALGLELTEEGSFYVKLSLSLWCQWPSRHQNFLSHHPCCLRDLWLIRDSSIVLVEPALNDALANRTRRGGMLLRFQALVAVEVPAAEYALNLTFSAPMLAAT